MDGTRLRLTAKLVAAYAGNNTVTARDLVGLIRDTYAALANAEAPEAPAAAPHPPAVPIKRSVSPDAVICLECGKPQKTLKRHINSAHGLSVAEYRAKWDLPADYPMVAPSYAQRRSELAVEIGLGRKKGAEAAAEEAAPAEGAAPAGDKPRHHYPASRWSKPAG